MMENIIIPIQVWRKHSAERGLKEAGITCQSWAVKKKGSKK